MINDFDNKKIQSFQYEKNINVDGKIIGTCELGNAEFQILNNSNEYSNLKGQWIKTIHGSFYIYDVAPVQEKINIKLSCYDIKYKLDTPYDSSLYTWPMSVKEWRNQIGINCGVEFDNSDFPNSDLMLYSEPYIGTNPSNRKVIMLIAEAGCSWVDNDSNDKLYFNWFEDITYEVQDWLELTTESKKSLPINVVILGRGDVEENVKWPNTMPDNPMEFRIDNNYILDPQDTNTSQDKRYDVIQPIYNRVNGFSNLIFSMRTQKIENRLSLKLGQKISYKDIWGNNLDAYVMSKTLKYLGGDMNDANNYELILSSKEIKESSTDYSYASSVQNDILDVQRKANKQDAIIEDYIKRTNDNSTQLADFKLTLDNIGLEMSKFTSQAETISKIELNLEEIKSSIGSVTDTTTSAKGTGNLELFNVLNSEILYLQIYPSSENLSYLYLTKDNLNPNDYLLSRDLIFKSEDNEIRFTLPCDLLYLNSDCYDEFILNYENQEMYVIHRVGLDNNGNKYALLEAQTEYFIYQPIILNDGDYNIKMLSFDTAFIYIRTLAKNLYTSQFATKIEMNSAIELTQQSITQSVTQKLDLINGDVKELNAKLELKIGKNDNDQIVSMINASADEINFNSNRLSWNSDNSSMTPDGKLTTNEVTIKNGNLSITSDGRIIINDTEDYENCMLIIQNKIGDIHTRYMSNGFTIQSDEYLFQAAQDSLLISNNLKNQSIVISSDMINIFDSITGWGTTITQEYVNSPLIEQTSLESKKKNFEKFSDALSIIDDIDLYKYNLKTEKDGTKKHIGFVIGESFKYSSEITSIDAEGNDIGVDLYSMTSFNTQCIKELKDKLEEVITWKNQLT